VNETSVANMALGRLGIGQTIASLDEATNPARQCKRWFDHCRDEVLRDLKPDFANVAEALALVADETYPGWGYVYQYPNECLVLHDAGAQSRVPVWYDEPYATGGVGGYRYYPYYVSNVPWKVALKADKASRVILSDIAEAWAFFTARVTNLNVWTPDAISALAWKLASEIAGAIQVKADLIQLARQSYEVEKSRTKAASRNEARQDRMPESPSIQIRS
jgi:hypothetical protein